MSQAKASHYTVLLKKIAKGSISTRSSLVSSVHECIYYYITRILARLVLSSCSVCQTYSYFEIANLSKDYAFLYEFINKVVLSVSSIKFTTLSFKIALDIQNKYKVLYIFYRFLSVHATNLSKKKFTRRYSYEWVNF